jgi:acetylornithine deacetylase
VTPSATIKEILEETLAGRARVEYLSAAEPVRMHSVEGFEREVVRFTTDIPYLASWGTPLLVGPGSILDAHTDGERVSKRELETSVELYMRLVRTLLASAPVQAQGARE